MARIQPNAEYWLSADGLALVQGWARDGLNATQLAENMGISSSTLTAWMNRHDALFKAVSFGRAVADRNVENALYKRAVGFSYVEKKTTVKETALGLTETTETETTKEVAPDVLAQIFWLKNRKPNEWRDRREVELGGEVGLVKIVDDISATDDDLIGDK